MVIVDEASGAALEASETGAPLALGRGAMPRAYRARRAHGRRPTSGHDGGTVHATAEVGCGAELRERGRRPRRDRTLGVDAILGPIRAAHRVRVLISAD